MEKGRGGRKSNGDKWKVVWKRVDHKANTMIIQRDHIYTNGDTDCRVVALTVC